MHDNNWSICSYFIFIIYIGKTIKGDDSMKIVSDFKKTLICKDKYDLAQDILEISIDNIFENEIVKQIPVIKSLLTFGNVCNSIKQRSNAKKFCKFLNELNSGSLSSDKLIWHINKLNNKPEHLNEELERIVMIIDSQTNFKKTQILGQLYKAYILNAFNQDYFFELTDVLDRLFLSDLKDLSNIYRLTNLEFNNFDKVSLGRLNAIGLVYDYSKNNLIYENHIPGKEFKSNIAGITSLGKDFFKFGVEPIEELFYNTKVGNPFQDEE